MWCINLIEFQIYVLITKTKNEVLFRSRVVLMQEGSEAVAGCHQVVCSH